MDIPLALYGLVLFGLGFAAGLVVAGLRKEAKPKETPQTPEPDTAFQPPNAQPENTPPKPPSEAANPQPVRWVPSAALPKTRQERAPNADVMAELAKYVLPKEKPKAASMAVEVDEILQELLEKSSMQGRDIRLLEQPDYGLLVVVDGEVFNGVGEVQDAAAHDLIQRAVAEWQRRTTARFS